METVRLGVQDAGEVMTLQRAAWVTEAHVNDTLDIPALHETLAVVAAGLADPAFTTWGLRDEGRLVGIVRTSLHDGEHGTTAHLGRLGVVPDRHGEGLGSRLLQLAEERLPPDVRRVELFTGAASVGNHRFYARHGYVLDPDGERPPGTVFMAKER